MTTSEPTLGLLIDLAAEMEQRAFDFYDALEKKFADNKEFVACLVEIKNDELLHQRVLSEIKRSLSDVRLRAIVTINAIDELSSVLDFLKNLDLDSLNTSDQICDAIERLEAVEFDVVMNFVGLEEINYEFTREYLKNESLEHSSRIFRAQQCLM